MTELSRYVFSPLREGDFTLYRGSCNGMAPILLVAAEDASLWSSRRLEHEYALKGELDVAWAARPVALSRYNDRLALVLEDPGGERLDQLLGRPLEVSEFLPIAIPLASALRRLHERGLIHKDVKPANVLVDIESGGVWLTGFGIASRLPRERQNPEPPEVIAGTLAYMAPEQTGRMNRSIDSRSDLYSLGITFYEMLTGTLPFRAADPMEWVHYHIARQVDPPDERAKQIPKVLSAIVMKLLAKTAEERYQTAAGVEADLRRCLAEWELHGRIDTFPLGAHDASDQLLIPEKLYGREREINSLLAAFDRVVGHGTTEFVLISGYSGVGKSSVVNELHKVLVPPRGLFATGKFDQYKRDIPYATLGQAFQNLVRSLLGQNETELARWRDALRDALGPNGQLMVNLVPELELVIGTQPPVADLPPQDARNRFQMVFRRFLGVFAPKERPLALFLDDLQWLDTATLSLLEHLVTHSEVRHLLLVGAYRDNEVGPAHPLTRTLEAIRKSDAQVGEIVLAPLGLDDVNQFVADALHCELARAGPLTLLVHEKTGGNPFFAIQFFTALAEEGLLAFDPGARAWQWDIDRIRGKNYTDNVVDLMAGKVKRFSATTQEALKQLACLGNVARTATLTLVHGKTEEAIHAALWEAVRAGFVFDQGSAYKFLHDRIQQAAYSLIPEEQRAEIHLRIGRVLLAGMTADELTEHLFDAASQLNRSAALLIDRDEKSQVATIDLRAGRKAKAAAAYASACVYFAAGMALLEERDWGSQYELTFSLWLERAECEFLTGNLDLAGQLIGELLQRGASKVDHAAVYQLKVQLHVVKGENPQAVDSALTCLRLFGIDIPAHPTQEQVAAEYETVSRNLEGRPTEDLIDLPLMTDPELQAAMQVLATLLGPAHVTDFQLYCLHLCRMVNISLQHGTSGASAHGFGWLGTILGKAFHRYPEGYRFTKFACDLVERRGFIAYQAKTYQAMGVVALWTQPLTTAIDILLAAFRCATDTGDLTFACYSMIQSVTGLLVRNDPLDAVRCESEMGLDFVREARFRDIEDMFVSQQRFIATMQGRTATFSTFNDAQFDEAAFEAQLTGDRMPTMTCWYWVLKLKARFLSGDYAEALAAADRAKALLSASAVHIQLLDYFYYTALTVAALYGNASADEQKGWGELLTSHQEQLLEWAENYPPTFGDKHALVSAEIARLEGRELDAERLYEQAIQSARENGFVQNEGTAHEVAARFYAARGFETIAHAYLRNARYCYFRWGAEGKVRQLEQYHPWLREDLASPPPTVTIGASVKQLDVATVVKASQAVSSEIDLGKLIETLTTIAVAHAGAERGLLILLRGDKPQIEAEATTGHGRVEVIVREVAVTPSDLPESMLHYVIRTRESVVLDDALVRNLYSEDEYVRQKRPRSVVCLPIVKQAKLVGALYLENNLTPHAFTSSRVAVLELLASQAAISLENARLYADLINENRVRQTAEDAMRESEERWHNLFESVPVGVGLIGSDGHYVESNPAFRSMTGYSEADLRGLSPVDITHEDDRTTIEAIIAANAVGEPYADHYEKRFRRRDGGIIWAEVSSFAIPVAGSSPLLAGVTVDITDRKQAEEELRRSEVYLTEAQRLSRTGSFGWNVSSGEIFWSDETFRIFEYDKAASVTLDMALQRVHPEDLALVQRTIERASQDGKDYAHEHRLLMPDSSVKHVHVVARAISDQPGNIEFVGAVMDITAAKETEAALKERASLLNLTHDSIFIRNMDGVISYWNRGSEELYGWTVEDAVGKTSHRLLQTVFPVPLAELNAELQRADLWEGELVQTKADGTRVVVASRWSLQRDKRQRPLAILETNDDITERKRAEEALRQAQAELAHATRLTTLGELTALIAHEVNQPLTGVVSSGNACLNWLDRQPPNIEKARRSVDRIIKQGNRAAEVIQRIRAFSQKTAVQKAPLDVNDLIEDVMPLVRHEVLVHNVSLRLELADALPPVLGDRVQLQQVIVNLLMNGIQAMRSVTDRSRELLIRSREHGPDQILVAIEDSGIGIEPENVDRLFDAFFTTKPDGMGMGLSICRSIVNQHSGLIWATPNSRAGSTFQFTLHACRETAS